MNILIVEDLWLSQMAAKFILEKEFQYEVDVAPNGIEAQDLARRFEYNFIFMDLALGEDSPDGFEVAQYILNYAPNRPKIIALTAHDDAKTQKKCIEAGMCAFIAKPLDADKVDDAFCKILSKDAKHNLKLLKSIWE